MHGATVKTVKKNCEISYLGVTGKAQSELYTNQHMMLWKIIAVYYEDVNAFHKSAVWV